MCPERNVRRTGVVVVAALIEQQGQILIGQRRPDQRHPLKWEFPGGKVEPGETPRQALRRELREELDIGATVGREIARYEHTYRGRRPILLIFYLVRKFDGEPDNRIFNEIRWERVERLPRYDFLDGDLDFIRRLARGEYRRVIGFPEPGATATTDVRRTRT